MAARRRTAKTTTKRTAGKPRQPKKPKTVRATTKAVTQKDGTSLTSEKHAELSPTERSILEKYVDRTKRHPSPPLKVTHGDGNPKVEINHPDPDVGAVLAMDAIGTASPSFFNGLISQLANLGTSKSVNEHEMNFALSMVEGIRPRDDTEGMLAAQMAAVHIATMTAARLLAKSSKTIEQYDSASRMLNQCARTFAAQVEALKKYRSNGEQIVKVQHVNVGNGGQAVITDTMQAGGGGGYGKNDH
jgi:hypothetical protein